MPPPASTPTGVIYRIYHKETMKCYIGKTIYPKRRIREHLNAYGSPYLANAINKHGKEAFCVEILEADVPEELLSKLEILHIRFFDCKAPLGYNLTYGGEGVSGLKMSAEARKKMSEAKQGYIPWHKGKTGVYSEEHLQEMSRVRKGNPAWNKGKTGVYSNETIAKMSRAKKGHIPWNKGKKGLTPWNKGKKGVQEAWNKGKSFSPESRRRMSEAHRGQVPWNKGKRLGASWNKGKTGIYSEETLNKIRRPEYEPARSLYFSLSSNMSLKKKRRLLRKQFPQIPQTTFYKWIRRWESELTA